MEHLGKLQIPEPILDPLDQNVGPRTPKFSQVPGIA